MNTESGLPAEVVDAISANRKIQAIKTLRESRGLGLREAKEMVEAYIRENPNLSAHRRQESESGVGRLILIAVIAAAGYVAYRLLV